MKEYKGSVLLISHDRYFLDSVITRIIELEFDSAEVYLGNYSYYIVEKERRFIAEYKNYQNQQKKIERIERQIERYRIWGTMRDSDKMFRRAKELEKRLEKVDVLDRPILEKRKIRLNQTQIDRSGKIVLETRGLSKSFDEKILFQKVDLDIRYQDSACIIGKNGCGKSTFLKMILDEPTNHLDIDSREVLEENLCNFEGTLLFVSHDRYFINKVADKMIILDGQEGKIYSGDYSYYLNEYHKEQAKLTVSSSEETKKEVIKPTTLKSQEKLGNKVKQERKLEQIEQEIEIIEEEIKSLEVQMELHSSDVDRFQEIFQEKVKLEENLEKLYVEWDSITSQLEKS